MCSSLWLKDRKYLANLMPFIKLGTREGNFCIGFKDIWPYKELFGPNYFESGFAKYLEIIWLQKCYCKLLRFIIIRLVNLFKTD